MACYSLLTVVLNLLSLFIAILSIIASTISLSITAIAIAAAIFTFLGICLLCVLLSIYHYESV